MSVLAPLKLAGLTCAGVGGTCSVVYAGGSWLSGFSGVHVDDDSVIQTVADKFSSRLIAKGRDSVWKNRLSKLKEHKDGKLDQGLEEIKTNKDGKKTEKDLQAWCEEAKIKPHSGEGADLIVKGVEDYCTYIIKDQVNKAISSDKKIDVWKSVNKRLMEYKGSLSDEMKKLREKVKSEDSTELQTWCFASYEKPFQDKNDQLYKDVSTFCVAIKQAQKPSDKSVKPDAAKIPAPAGDAKAAPTGDPKKST
ncbi:hypothetical protein HF1_07400 [Mycoplasma haemofelis str. Langford 1]|uniref:Uncharacterized protein n=1 Tax=Mycoplasma haemofelis (strain Langford 1) TaxID=941640 RepID=E8ZHX7_MYCHL|nr:hypothetical protein [Mycoplasma haemofelis]CBY92748.1 hypothetical protein HF1_07400 [Mycoplasma haemofelis str. Langford 1]